MNRAERRNAEHGAGKLGARVAADVPCVREAVNELLADATVEQRIASAARETTQVALRALLQSPGFVNGVRDIVRDAALDCAKEILAEDMGDLETRVRRIVSEHWEANVSSAAHQVLSEALTTVKRRITGLP